MGATKSVASLNVIKMLTAVQAVPVTVVDTTAHPAILGYTCAKSGKGVGPHLYKDGVFVGDHDSILRMHSAGSLQAKLGNPDGYNGHLRWGASDWDVLIGLDR